MSKRYSPIVLVTAVVVLTTVVTLGFSPRSASASDCSRTSVGFKPLTELGTGMYQGNMGGLYPNGLNEPPAAHRQAALDRAARIQPLDANGQPSPSGKVVLLSLGMSNATQEFSNFVNLMRNDPQRSSSLVIVDGAQGGQTASVIRNPGANFWTVVDQRLQAAGVTGAQVQAIWLKEANAGPTQAFPTHATMLTDDLQAVAQLVHQRFANTGLIYLSSRTYAGYASTTLNPEPYAYESGFAVRWLIERQINGDADLNADLAKGPVQSPWLLWGPYLWADGLTPRADGLTWRCEDFAADGTHPSDPSGRLKVANLLVRFFKTDATTRSWFMADPNATPLPSATPGPARPSPTAGSPQPSRTPGPTQPGGGATPGALTSFRLIESPTGNEVWGVSTSRLVLQRMPQINPNRTAWYCGRATADAGQARGFYLGDQGSALELDVPATAKTTILAIQQNVSSSPAPACILIQGAAESRSGWPPGVVAPTSTAGTPRTPTSPAATSTPQATRTPDHEPSPTIHPTLTPSGLPPSPTASHMPPGTATMPHDTATPPVPHTDGRLFVPWVATG